MRKQHGFTLIELLVVVAILGILAAVAIPNVLRFMESGKVEAANTEMSNVQTAVLAYMADSKLISIPVADKDVTPADKGIADEFLTGELKGSYTIDTKGTILGTTYDDGDGDTTKGVIWDSTKKLWKLSD